MINKLYFQRYKPFNSNGVQSTVPFIKLDEKSTDKKVVWKTNVDRMDKYSNTYYSDPRYGWLILLANPQFTMENDIPDQTIIRIPYPLTETMNEYLDKSNNFSNNN
jgi:hypothetical protein